MSMLVRRLTWRKPFALERLPWLSRWHKAAYSPSRRLRHELLKLPLRRAFDAAYRLGLGEGSGGRLRLKVGGQDKVLPFRARNLQFAALYMPQHAAGYEPETWALLDALVAPSAVFFDAGSNWGYYALGLAAREGFSGSVHAFEPSPESFRDLEALAAGAGLGGRVTGHQLALSDQDGTGALSVPDGVHGGTATLSASGPGAGVAMRRLDGLGLPDPAVVKLDVEGHEAAALRGAAETLRRARPHLVFESWLRTSAALTLSPFELLEAEGYRFFLPSWREAPADLKDGLELALQLVPFESPQRLLMREALNVLACHVERLPELRQAFERA